MKTSDKALLGLLALAIVIIGAGLILPVLAKAKRRPSLSVQREQQRKEAYERVEAAGGWEVLQRECLSLLATNSNDFFWRPAANHIDNEPLPPALASLKPRKITMTRADPPIMQIHVFGYPRTGGGTPYYYLYIVCGPVPEDFKPELDFEPHHLLIGTIQKITNSVFEVY